MLNIFSIILIGVLCYAAGMLVWFLVNDIDDE
ncbi:Uncharacterised protein [Serratia ficaria]|nr:Uncharacterised protein [Serratia ficaria]